MASRKALIVHGGWDGHTPKRSAELFATFLQDSDFEVVLSDTLDVYLNKHELAGCDLIVPIWTMGQISDEQGLGLLDAVSAGSGLAGFHGGMCDSFRNHTVYQWMTGGQWVAHPGDIIPEYAVHIARPDHPITAGISDFKMIDTEQYWMHVDPSNEVLATTTFEHPCHCVMPYAWTRNWGKGKVFYAAWGHTWKDFEIPEARQIVQRGMLWAAR